MEDSLSSLLDDSGIPQFDDYDSHQDWLCAVLDRGLGETYIGDENERFGQQTNEVVNVMP